MLLRSAQGQVPRGLVRAPPPASAPFLSLTLFPRPCACFLRVLPGSPAQLVPPLQAHLRQVFASPYPSLTFSFPLPAAQVEVDVRWGWFPILLSSSLWFPRPNLEPAFLYPRSHLFSVEMEMRTNTLGSAFCGQASYLYLVLASHY